MCKPVLASERALDGLRDTQIWTRAWSRAQNRSLGLKIGRLRENRSSIKTHPFMEIPWNGIYRFIF
jgi:hypothetical protein